MNKFDPTVPFQGHKPLFTNEVQAEYNVTSLNNGFTVLTETQTFPGAVNMGKYNFHTHRVVTRSAQVRRVFSDVQIY